MWTRFRVKRLAGATIAAGFAGSFAKVVQEAPGPHNVDPGTKLPRPVPLDFSPTWRVHAWWVSRLAGLFVQSVYGLNEVSFEGVERLKGTKATQAVLWAANHNSYLDGWFLGYYLNGGWRSWILPWFDGYNFTVSGCYVVFPNRIISAFASLGRGVPVQGRVLSNGVDLSMDPIRSKWLDLNEFFLNDISKLVLGGKRVLIFPEGRIWQEALETRSPEGRLLLSYDASPEIAQAGAPCESIGPFYWGIGKIVARTGCKVLPIGHYGNQHVLPSNAARHIDFKRIKLSRKRVHVVIGEPMGFGALLENFLEENPDVIFPIEGDSVKELELYSHITRCVREAVLECEARAKQVVRSKTVPDNEAPRTSNAEAVSISVSI